MTSTPHFVPPTTSREHPGPSHHVWQRGDVFRAVLFGTLAVVYAVLLFPITVAVLVLWLVGKVIGGRPSDEPTPARSA